MSELCSLCQVIEVGPYCPTHGLVHRPFSIGGRYAVEELIAAGEASLLFGARAQPAGRPVVIKVLRSPSDAPKTAAGEAELWFLRRAAALRAFAHDHLVGAIDFGRDDALGAAYLVMDRLSGETAEAMVRERGPLRWQQVIPLLMQVVRAVAAAHEHGIADGGLTAKAVFVVDSAGRPVAKLCGFGLASTASTDPRDDIYGIGVIAHELLTGRPPPEGCGVSDSLSDDPLGMNEQNPALGLPNRLDELIRACRLRNPNVRPSLDEIEATLRSFDPAPSDPDTVAMPAVKTDPLAMPTMIGSYRVVAQLGSGGTGRVYLGEHPMIGSKVAIKILLPEIARNVETVERFILEARASSQIGSPYIPRYFDFGTTPAGLPYAIMEYFEGETLGQRLTRVGTMSVAETAQIVEQVANALLMAHDAGLIHRDLKPDNIFLVRPDPKATRQTPIPTAAGSGLLKPSLEVKVLDFGIAKTLGNPSALQTLTGAFLGSPFYCAPEQVLGHEVDARTDVYGLGATACQMLTGAPPFAGEVHEILSAKATEDPPDLLGSGVPAAVAHTLRRMLARLPADRAPSMAWVLEEVAHWPRSGSLDAGPPAQRHPADPRDPGVVGRTETELPESDGARDPATMPTMIHARARRHRRPRRRAAVIMTAGMFAVGALIGVIVVSSSRSTPPASSTPDVAAPSAARPTARAVPPAPPAGPHARDASAAPGGSTATAGAAEHPPEHVESAGSAPGDASSGSPPARPPGSGRTDQAAGQPATGAAPHRPRAKPTLDKKPTRKPKPDEPEDVLIVDPFSESN